MRDKKPNPPIEDLVAGEAFVQSVVPRADSMNYNAPLWHGWAIIDAFLAGAAYARARSPSDPAGGKL